MPKSDFVKKLDAVQADVHTFLGPLDFYKKGRTHNRQTSDGIRHAINFQMGQYPIGEQYVIPGLRENLYGFFTVNLGVLLPCVYEAEWNKEPRAFVQEYDCTIRGRLGIIARGKDMWFDLSQDTGTISMEIIYLLDEFGFPFLKLFTSYADVLAFFSQYGKLPFMNTGRASLVAGLVANHIGNKTWAEELFREAYTTDNKGFKKYVSDLAGKNGISLD